MKQEEAKNTPLTTAALAHVDDRNPKEGRGEERAQERVQERAQERAPERVQERVQERLAQHRSGAVAEERAQERLARQQSGAAVGEPGSVAWDADRPPLEDGPTLVQSATPRTGEALRDQNRIDPANRQTGPAATTSAEEQAAPLFAERESKDLFAKWDALQVDFIDEPRRAVERADHLVAEAMKRTAEIFAEERARLERQWDRGDNVSTEDLRVAMRRYRSFFRRLLAV